MQSWNISTWDKNTTFMYVHTLANISKHVLQGFFYWDYPSVKVRLEFHYETALMTRLRAWNSHNLNIWGGFSLALLFLTWNGTLLTMAWRQSGQSARQQVRITDLCSNLFYNSLLVQQTNRKRLAEYYLPIWSFRTGNRCCDTSLVCHMLTRLKSNITKLPPQ